jgi:tetracycline resistance efflux pump
VVLAKSIPLNFYALLAVFGVAFIILTGFDFGPMKQAEIRARKTGLLDRPKEGEDAKKVAEEGAIAKDETKATSAANLLIPIGSMVGMILAGLLITGKGSLLKGNGNIAILWGVTFAILVTGIAYVYQKIMTYKEYIDTLFHGIGNLLPVASILMFAFSLGDVIKQLGTGDYIANLFSGIMTPALLPAIIFLISAIISLATGTSMGTMALMFPLMIPTALTVDANILLCVSAIFGGSIFGDHTSPISDTTIMTSMTTGCDIIDHVTTQLPYTLTIAGITTVLYLLAAAIF